jgi:hypothetical protein
MDDGLDRSGLIFDIFLRMYKVVVVGEGRWMAIGKSKGEGDRPLYV